EETTRRHDKEKMEERVQTDRPTISGRLTRNFSAVHTYAVQINFTFALVDYKVSESNCALHQMYLFRYHLFRTSVFAPFRTVRGSGVFFKHEPGPTTADANKTPHGH
ncbi:unnamed protein product, partial [Ectocarpus sp. 12 AP-2014]